MAELTTAWMLGCVCGFFFGATVAGRRRPTCRDLMSGGNVGAAPTNVGGNFVSGDYNRKTGLVGNGSTKYLNCNRANNADPQNSND